MWALENKRHITQSDTVEPIYLGSLIFDLFVVFINKLFGALHYALQQ